MRCLGILGLLVVTACSQLGGAPAPNSGGAASSKDATPKRDVAALRRALDQLDKGLDDADKEMLRTFDVALGKADPMKTKKKAPVADLVTYLRAKKVPLRLGTGKHSRREKFMLDEDAKVEFNSGPGKGLKSPQRTEIFDKWDQLEMQLEEVHNSSEQTLHGLIDFNMAIMLLSGKLVAERHKAGLDLDDTDYGAIAALIAGQQRVEQLAAVSTAYMTAYHAVIRDKKDPKVIAQFVTEAAKGFPTKGAATVDDAKAYVASLQKDSSGAKERYYSWMKELWGEEDFPSFKGAIDDKFAQLDQLLATEKRDPPSAPASTPADAARAGGGSGAATGAGAVAAARQQAGKLANGAAGKGVDAAAKGDVGGMVDAAADLLPIDGRAKSIVHGAVALAKGDYKGAINAVTNIVPDGPLKSGMSLIAKLF